MFDVGFQELVLIALVALLVVGPERLPRLVRTAGLWLGRGRRILGSVKSEIDRELKADELKEILRKQAASNPLTTILEDTGSMVTRSLKGASTTGFGSGSEGGNTDALIGAGTASTAQAPAPTKGAGVAAQTGAPPAAPPGATPNPDTQV
jgi:sec-independent protein translocase protein TatB